MNGFNTIDRSSQYLDVAAELDIALTQRFGIYESAPTYPDRVQGTLQLAEPLALLTIAELAGNCDGLTSIKPELFMASLQVSVGQTGILAYHDQATKRPVAHPAIIEGTSADNNGLRLTYLAEDISATPIITDLQDMVLRAAVELHAADVGLDTADGQASTAVEKGHATMGLRTITDPQLIDQIVRRQHPVHDWKVEGIAEKVTTQTTNVPGMYDVAGRPPVDVRNIDLYSNTAVEILYHPSFRSEGQYPYGLTAEKISRGLGIVAARKQGVLFVENKLIDALGAITKTAKTIL